MTRLVALLLLLAPLAGCSETDPGVPDSERIAGTWTAATANVRVRGIPVGIPVADLTAAGDVQTFTFRPDGTFSFLFDPAEGRTVTISYRGETYVTFPLTQTVTLAGTYTLNETGRKVRFSTIATATADDFQMGYGFGSLSGSGALELVAEDPQTLARLFGLADADASRLAEFVTGGSVTYTGS